MRPHIVRGLCTRFESHALIVARRAVLHFTCLHPLPHRFVALLPVMRPGTWAQTRPPYRRASHYSVTKATLSSSPHFLATSCSANLVGAPNTTSLGTPLSMSSFFRGMKPIEDMLIVSISKDALRLASSSAAAWASAALAFMSAMRCATRSASFFSSSFSFSSAFRLSSSLTSAALCFSFAFSCSASALAMISAPVSSAAGASA
mmetsp:Transcript_2739/g.7600  ORF Transcript_2739/g.7600 Transcript_2739/m.7600 type:complete len:204 (+) Transcript_2739:220-831(+)